ncbi:maleylpyruvate isomerase family mycothiol-dependent enzyme [Actinoplanes utahensis]|uniref:Mycothiol-dependent maleylpyruvate isomerase metal-binding domain-containing protein n=1 Tax=Actinoplanes utahensis TaxID=1869 RepID=A0A0A6XAP8_ACTUT|nr:maleylpyruvate isomerase family mycothiol-dependent enzyme [Actinoplanes utahensis]KHD77177.1 hypothetical protein MB27_12015 [Actinoplanes utahensis]GIF35615.1 hypothetical protein Aut01nite_86010 [Actinoplanes utahensis]
MTLDYLTLLDAEFAAFQDCLDGDLTAPVEHCGDWTLRDLAVHLGQGNLWAATAIVDGHGRYQEQPPPEDVATWFAQSARTLTGALAREPETAAWTFAPPRTVGFWRRRRCLETAVHRWDAEHALGRAGELDPALCADGVAEVLEMFLPRQIRLGRAEAPEAAVRFEATDTAGTWVLGPGEPVATITGTAQELMLALWGRAPWPWGRLTGDREAAEKALARPLVP